MPTKNAATPTYEQLINQAVKRLVLIITLAISAIILIVVGTQQTVNTTHEAHD